MGCFPAKLRSFTFKRPSKSNDASDGKKIYSWDLRKNINPKDFTIENLKEKTVGRIPGTINGQQFIIQNCEDCNIYIFDYMSMVTVDDCVNCNIFFGPTKGSVFIRNCKDSRIVVASQQFRSRDCHRVDVFLCCATQPSIESCTEMRFGCFCFFYPQLEEQFKEAGLSLFNNSWCQIHDFTPGEVEHNWSLLPQDARIEDFLPVPATEELSQVQVSADPLASIVPQTLGTHHKLGSQRSLVVFFSDGQSQQRALYFVREMEKTSNALVRTKEVTMEQADAERVFCTDSYNTVIKRGPVIALEYTGEDCIKACQDIAKAIATETGSTGLVYVSSHAKIATRQIDSFFNYAEMQLLV